MLSHYYRRSPAIFIVIAVHILRCVHAIDLRDTNKRWSLAPSNVEVTFPAKLCGDMALVKWEKPRDFFFLSKYYVKCASLEDRVVKIVHPWHSFTKIGPLDIDANYTCEVTAKVDDLVTETAVSKPFVTM